MALNRVVAPTNMTPPIAPITGQPGKLVNLSSKSFVKTNNLPVSSAPIVSSNQNLSNKFFSSKLLNYVEPFDFFGVDKTAFYSELSTNFKVGDRVFILNGHYDSDDFIKKDKYTKYTDGYRVLGVDGCRIILDIDYTGLLPYEDFKLEDLIFVHHVTTQQQFDYINSLKVGAKSDTTGLQLPDSLYSMFEGKQYLYAADLLGRNIIYISSSFIASSNVLNLSNGVNLSDPGFYIKDGNDWNNISFAFIFGTLTDANSYTNPNSDFSADKIMILGEDFVFNGVTFRERQVYKFDRSTADPTIPKNGDWVFDKHYKQPIISKLNFRYGNFKGTHNDGIFGSYDKPVNWNGYNWNSGVFVNSIWNSGQMNNKSITEQSSTANLVNTRSGLKPTQNIDFSNNKGFGYNFFIDSTMKSGIIKRGNFENANIGITFSVNTVDSYYKNTLTYSVTSEFVNMNFCNVYNNYISEGFISDSIIDNSVIFNSKSVNNQLIDCVVDKSQYNSDGGIEIVAADIWSYDYNSSNLIDFTSIIGTIKLYISDKDFLRLEKGDSFYIEKLNKELFLTNLTRDARIHLPLETRYLLNFYDDYEMCMADGIVSKVTVSLKPKTNNYVKYVVASNKLTNQSQFPTPNTDQILIDFVNDIYTTYWTLIEGFGNQWDVDRQYNLNDYVIYGDPTVLYTWTGFTESNEIPTNPTPSYNDYAWQPLTQSNGVFASPSFWEETQIYNSGDFVYAKLRPNEDYLLFKCLTTTDDGFGSVIQDSISIVPIISESIRKTQTFEENTIKLSSIDIESDSFAWFVGVDGKRKYTQQTIDRNSSIINIPIDSLEKAFIGSYLKISDFRSGVFKNSTWLSGYNKNYYGNIVSKLSAETLDIGVNAQANNLRITLRNNPHNYEYNTLGLDLKRGDSVWLNTVSYTGTNSQVSISDRYVVVNDPTRISTQPTYDVLIRPTSITVSNINSKTFSVFGAEGNLYTSLSNFNIDNSIINYGFFQRTSLNHVIFTNDQFNNDDLSFNPSNINLLRLLNITFAKNNVTVNDGVIYKSHIVDPVFNTGIVHNSIWNGATLSNGIISNTTWKSGKLLSGKYFDSNSTTPSTDTFDEISSYRAWQGGTFETGDFVNSVWLDGVFNNGNFYNSHFYGGVWNNGILGSRRYNMMNTSFGFYRKLDGIGATSCVWNYGVVDNAIVGGNGVVYWYDGKFNAGELTSYGTTSDNETIWYNGEFNGSKITNLARWKDGVFNSGKFWSYYGWENVSPTNSSNLASDYAWENGKFYSGDFGYRGLTSNSTWYNGQFFGGQFLGRFWKNGTFINGYFEGSSFTNSRTPSLKEASRTSNEIEFSFANAFIDRYYGLWNDGFVYSNVRRSPNDEVIATKQIRSRYLSQNTNNQALFNSIIWMNGTFSSDVASFRDSIWMSGTFQQGRFINSIFNPYVDRDFTGSFSNSSFGTTSVWLDGTFESGAIWNSDWMRGVFKDGHMSGVRWYNGTFEYGDADNIYWIDGTWRNGNWNGSPYDYTYITNTESNVEGITVSVNYMTPGRELDVILKVASYNEINNGFTQSNLHLLNIFSVSSYTTIFSDRINDSDNWTYSTEYYVGIEEVAEIDQFGVENFSYPSVQLTKSIWEMSDGFDIVTSTTSGFFITDLFPNGLYITVSTVIPQNIQISADKNLVTIGGTNSFVLNKGFGGYNTDQESDYPPSSKLFGKYTGSTNIFTVAPSNYSIQLTVAVELSPSVEVECFVGGLSSSVFNLASDSYRWSKLTSIKGIIGSNRIEEFASYHAKVYTITLNYNTSSELLSRPDGQKFAIRKNSNGILRILNATIRRRAVEYHPTLNNRLVKYIDLTNGTVNFPATSSIDLKTISANGYEIGSNFGNGSFKSGIWENGVWNNGYRSSDWFADSDIIRVSDIDPRLTYSVGKNTWRVTLQCLDQLKKNDGTLLIDSRKKISVGNLVCINVNGKRSYLREPMKIVSISYDSLLLTFEFVSNFEIRTIKKDSENHLIYITQNVWQNGVFLNGYFKGIWSNGVFKGYPKLTEMIDSHWVTGYFDGGHFQSVTLLENKNAGIQQYNTGLIQNIQFNDRNVASPTASAYESWVDVNYSTYSYVNLNNYSKLISQSKKTSQIIESFTPNLSGYPTFDILSSDSFFRNRRTTSINKYSLGTKYQIYYNYLAGSGDFTTPLLYPIGYSFPGLSLDEGISNKIKNSNFFSLGWTFSWTTTAASLPGVVISSNLNESTNQKLRIQIVGNPVSNGTYSFNLQNTRIVTRPDRYYITEVQMSDTYSNWMTSSLLLNDNPSSLDSDLYVHKYTNQKTYREYFYNTQGLNLTLISADTRSPVFGRTQSIERVAFYEVDSVPFFKYYKTQQEIDFSIKNPYVGTAPVIDYTNKNFDFIGNVELGIDFRVIVRQNVFSVQNGNASAARYNRVTGGTGQL